MAGCMGAYGLIMLCSDMTVLRPGFVLDHYTLQGFLRSDANRSVWVAREAFTERIVNVHLCTEQGEFRVARFERAMSILSRLDHPAIARLVGSGYHDGSPYLVTEHVNGPTLDQLVVQGGRMRELQVLRLAVQIADAFDQAWTRAEVIHRDLKPGSILINVMAMRDNKGAVEVKVTDFGQALGKRLVDQFEHDLAIEESDFQRVTRAERVGSPICMSPEQILGRELGPGTDIYALGVTMYLLLAGRPPFTGDDAELQRQHIQVPPPDLPADISSGTRALVRRMLGKLPERRFDSWGQLRDQISSLVKLQERKPSRRTATDGNPPTTEIRFRRTERFDNTPAGQPIPEVRLPPPQTEPGQAGVESLLRMLDRLVQLQPPALAAPQSAPAQPSSSVQLSRPAQPAAPQMVQGASLPPPDAAGGQPPQHFIALSSDQLNTLWSYLFTRGEASVASSSTPSRGSPALTGAQTSRSEQVLSPTPYSQPESATAPPAAPVATPPAVATTAMRTPVADGQRPTERMTAQKPSVEDQPAAQPVVTPWSLHDAVFTALAIPVLQAHGSPGAHGGESVTKRITLRFKRILGNRESIQVSIDQALRNGDLDGALRMLDDLAERGGNDGPICLRRARYAGLRGDYAAMIDWAQSAIVQKVEDPVALAMVAYGNLRLGKEQITSVICRNLAEANPTLSLGPLFLAAVAIIAGDAEAAAEHLTAAEQIDPEHPTLILLTAAWWRVAGDVASEVHSLIFYRDCHGVTPEIAARFAELGYT